MLKEQLQQLKKSTRTLLHKKDSLVKFIQNDDIDTYTLFNNLPFPTKYTGPKSLNFDRHKLSEREERKFNSRFIPFLKGLISRMNEDNIEIILEYLLRVYNIDTFNTKELVFLLLPFKKYFDQLKTISENTRNQFCTLERYSISSISKVIYRDRYLFLDFVEYFKCYDVLQPFLDRMLDELIEMVKTSEIDYLTEFFQIMSHLIENKNAQKALSIYHRMRSYLNTQEFIDILLPHFSIDIINMNTNVEVVDKYEVVFRNSSGRSLLKNPVEFHKYLNYLRSTGKIPKEFNKNEFSALMEIFFGEKSEVTNFSDLVNLFRDIEPKGDLINFIVKNDAQKYFIDEMNDIQKAILLGDRFDISLFTATNYEIFIKRMRRDTFKSNYRQILEKALSFVTFDPVYFDEVIVFDDLIHRNAVFRQNFIKLADKTSTDLCKYFAETDLSTDFISLSYILTHTHSVESLSILNVAKSAKNVSVISDLSIYISNNLPSLLNLGFDINEHIRWCLHARVESCILSLVHSLSHLVDYDTLYEVMIATNDEECLAELEKRDSLCLIKRIVESASFDLILAVLERNGVVPVIEGVREMDGLHSIFLNVVVNNHAKIFESVSGCDKLEILDFLLQNIKEQAVLSVILVYFNTLIELRKYSSWIVAKSIIIETISETHQYQLVLDHVLNNFGLFSDDDEDLFTKILTSKIDIDVMRFKSLKEYPHAAVFIHTYIISRGCDQILPIVPFITPLLMKYKMSSIELIFNTYGNIMSVYIRDILRQYPEMNHLLLNVDPKQALEEVCDEFDISRMSILQKLLNSKVCKDVAIFKKICKILCSNIESADVISLIRFYRRSLGNSSKSVDYVKKVIMSLYTQNTTVFYRVADEAMHGNSDLFVDPVKLILEDDVNQCVVPDVNNFLCSYFENDGIFEDTDGSVFDEIFKMSGDFVPKLASLVACNEYGNVDHAIEMVISNIRRSQSIALSLEILLEILNIRSDIKDIYGDDIMTVVSMYTEDKDQTVANLSKNIIELVQ